MRCGCPHRVFRMPPPERARSEVLRSMRRQSPGSRRRTGPPCGDARCVCCRTAASHSHVLRSGRLDRTSLATRPGGPARGDRPLPRLCRPTRQPLRRLYMGDGVLVYFGYPHAHEDDTEQAVRAGLTLIDAIGELQAPQRLQVRIGIATGLVVVGDLIGAGSAQEQAVVGETPNLAARLQALAEPNAVVIGAGTRRQIGSMFELVDLGPQDLKGFATTQDAWRVLAENRTLGRFEALRPG